MKRILIGGSPCKFWSISQKLNRETKPEGMGWELFKNFLIAKEKFKPDFFLYENNESASAEIKEQISKELGYPLTHINAALVSAQNRKRIYCTNVPVPQPEDRGILLKDILDSGVVDKEKAYCLKHQAGNARDYLKKHHTGVAFEPVCVAQRGRYDEEGKVFQHYEASEDGKTNTLTTVSKDNLVAEPIPFNPSSDGKCRTIKAQYGKSSMANFTSTGNYGATGVIEPVRIGDIDTTAQAHRVYSPYGKSVNLTANGGGQGAKTGLYMTPVRVGNLGKDSQGYRVYSPDGKAIALTGNGGGIGSKTGLYSVPVSIADDDYKALTENEMGYMLRETADGRNHFDYGYIQDTTKDKSKCVLANLHKGVPYNVMAETVEYVDLDNYSDVEYFDNGNIKINGKMIYLVKDGQIGYNDNFYPIKLPDGYYLIRKLTPEECEKLMTLPVGYTKVKGNSNTQRFKQLGNGWVAEVIMHIMRQWNIPLDEEIEVLSMYDGIATGRYCLDKLGYKNVTYKAAEVDKYAINVATTNWPDIIEIGDAFQVREEGWSYDGDDQRLEVG